MAAMQNTRASPPSPSFLSPERSIVLPPRQRRYLIGRDQGTTAASSGVGSSSARACTRSEPRNAARLARPLSSAPGFGVVGKFNGGIEIRIAHGIFSFFGG